MYRTTPTDPCAYCSFDGAQKRRQRAFSWPGGACRIARFCSTCSADGNRPFSTTRGSGRSDDCRRWSCLVARSADDGRKALAADLGESANSRRTELLVVSGRSTRRGPARTLHFSSHSAMAEPILDGHGLCRSPRETVPGSSKSACRTVAAALGFDRRTFGPPGRTGTSFARYGERHPFLPRSCRDRWRARTINSD